MNLGGAIGPLLAMQVRQNLGIAYVLVMSSLVSLGLVFGTLFFFREPPRPADAPPPKSMAKVLADMLMVFRDLKFMSFLVIFSGFWIMFWQIFYALPFYVRDVLHFEKFEIIETVDAWTIILITIPITALAKRVKQLEELGLEADTDGLSVLAIQRWSSAEAHQQATTGAMYEAWWSEYEPRLVAWDELVDFADEWATKPVDLRAGGERSREG